MAKVLFSVILFAIAISFTFGAKVDNNYAEEEDNQQNPFKQAMAVFDMISKVHEFKGRALKSFPDPVQALAELTLFGAVKLGFIMISGLILLSGFFPALLTTFGIPGPFLIRSVSENIGELKHLNYEMVARSLRSLPEKSFDALDVKGEDCRSRAVCEIGSYGSRAFPSMVTYVRAITTKFNFSEKYLVAIIKGFSNEDCGQTYRSCANSPFKKLSYLSTYNIF